MTDPVRISSPPALINSVPYLLGFKPSESMVVIGIGGGFVKVTARLDLTDCDTAHLVDLIAAFDRSGCKGIVAIIFTDSPDNMYAVQANKVSDLADDAGMEVIDALLVRGRKWSSYHCRDRNCCPPDGTPLPDDTPEIAVAAISAGMTVESSREAIEAELLPKTNLDWMLPLFDNHPSVDMAEAVDLGERAMLGQRLTVEQTVKLGIGLLDVEVRDAFWMQMENTDSYDSPLWLRLAVTLPPPYCITPLFLYAWQCYRRGDGVRANTAADRCEALDPDYSAVALLNQLLVRGVNPKEFPKLLV